MKLAHPRSIGAAILTALATLSASSAVEYRIGAEGARLDSFAVADIATPLRGGEGGFSLFDAGTKQRIPLGQGRVDRSGNVTTYESGKSGDIAVHARFIPQKNHLLVKGEITNLRGGERGVVLEYRLPLAGADARFSNQLNRWHAAADGEVEGCVFPIAAMSAGGSGVAFAIPPSSPCQFGMAGGPDGLAVRIFLGLSPETRRFPDRAAFSFIVYPINPGWGFRSALSRYYSFFADYYQERSNHPGQALFLAEDGREPEPVDVHNFSTRVVETQAAWLQANLDADKAAGRLSFPYMIVGQREIKYLEKLPATYEEAMAAYAKWTPEYQAQFPRTKENEAAGGDANLRLEVDSSAIERVDGKVGITLRRIPWGGNAVTFVTNPNPDLFADTHDQSVGRTSIDRIWEWARKYPKLDGAVIDSLGANWPANFNYRKEHFRYARYPLSCDPDGRPVLDNVTSHYEFLETLRHEFRTRKDKERFIAANGIYSYAARPEPAQHYRTGTHKQRTRLGRFFLAALIDFAVSEPGINSAQESLEFMRVAMGRKIYSPSNARWTDEELVRRWVNTCLVFDLFAVNQREYGDELHYYFPDGYARDRDLFNWFVPKARMLSRAGWQPVTHARTDAKDVLLERYGTGDTVYWVLMSKAAEPQTCVLDVEWNALGMDATQFPQGVAVDEIAQGATVRLEQSGKLVLNLEPYKTCIVIARRL